MKGGEWIEQIRVRSTAAALDAALPGLREQVEAIDASLPSVQPFFLQHALYAGDLAVVLVWRFESGAWRNIDLTGGEADLA